MSVAFETSPNFELQGHGKGTYVQWTDMSPSPHARSPLTFALSASASLSTAAWCSTPKVTKISKAHEILTSSISKDDIISSPAAKLEVMHNKAYTGEGVYGDTCASPLVRAVSAVASFGLMSWRTSRGTQRSIPHGSRAETRETLCVSSSVPTHNPSSGMLLPSVGALLHSAGSCKPCAWFWKPNGCANGADCKHCHLCPQDELRRRKKTKAAQLKQMEKANLQESTCGSGSCNDRDEQAGVYIDDFCSAKRDTMVEASVGIAVPNANGGDLCNLTEVGKTSATLASEGSRLHGSGACRPCSWFWKPQGCQYGAECLHCHLCLDGEQRRRKKEKTMVLRAAGVPKNKRIGVQDTVPNF